jgi:hypothetical protein
MHFYIKQVTLDGTVIYFNIKQCDGSKCLSLRQNYSSWSRHYATSLKVAGLIPDEVIGFFN